MIRLSFQWSCCHFHLVSCTQQEVKGHFGLASYVKCFGFFWWEWYWIAVNRNMFFVQKYWTKFVWIYSIGLFFPQVVIKYANMPIFNYSSSLKKNKKNLVNRFRKFWCLVLLDWSLKSNESDLPQSLGFDILICCKDIQPDSRSIMQLTTLYIGSSVEQLYHDVIYVSG